MIVRTYARRTRCIGRSFSDTDLLDGSGAAGAEDSDLLDPPLSQDGSQDPFTLAAAAFSSQDSSPWSFDPDLLPPISFEPPNGLPPVPLLPPAGKSSKPGKNSRHLKRVINGDVKNPQAAGAATATATATLMEAQEFGEMMEHVDEVNFALDGLRSGQPTRIRRASLLSLLSICGTAQQRRLLRAQGMAKRIIDAILGLNFDDSPSTVAAAALFYVLASDLQDDHLLDSPSCIHFLLELLHPPPETVEDKAPAIGCKLLGIRNPHILGGAKKRIDSSSRAIISKVEEILLSCKEIKSVNRDDEEIGRPELSSRWISLLTMEKACISTVSFEDTSDTMRRDRENFKERLRELGGLDAIFDVVSSCHSTMVEWFKNNSPSVSDLNDGLALHSLVLLLKCLKIMENATFLSRDNQDHLLGMKGKLDSEGFPLSFVGVVISAIKFFSALSQIQSSSNISNTGKSNCLSKSVNAYLYTAPEVHTKDNHMGNRDGTSSSQNGGRYGIKQGHHKRQKSSASQLEVSVSGSEVSAASMKKRGDHTPSISCNGASSGTSGESHINANGQKMSSVRVSKSNGWIPIKANASKRNSGSLSKRPCMSEDPFAFDECELEPSKWELLAMKKETSQTHQSTVIDREPPDGCDQLITTIDQELSQLTNEEINQCANFCSSEAEEDSNLLEDCLLTAIKVLMNLTNDNPVGCQQIAACGGLDTMASLIISHFPSFDLCFSMDTQLKVNISASDQTDDVRQNNRHLNGHELELLVAILGLLVNLVEKDSRNRSRLASSRISVDQPGRSESRENHKDVITLLCSIFLANQGSGEVAGEGRLLLSDDEASLLQGEREAEMMIIEAYAALLLAFLSTESNKVREAIASCLPNHNLQVLVPVLERFVAFHLTLNMISPETHSAVAKVIESCKVS